MELTKENKDVLRSFSNINEQVYITSDTLGIASNDKSMIAYYDYGVSVSVPGSDGFGIYNLSEFLSVLNLYENPSIQEKEGEVLISEGKGANRYRYADKNVISRYIPPKKDVLFGEKIKPAKSII